ncbi:hypothetical protein Tco_0872066 [Tanacetum coccineum]
MLDDMNISDSEDNNTAHLPKIKARPEWLKPVPEEDIPASLEPDWTGDISSFVNWFCKRIRKKKRSKADLEGPTFKVVQPFHDNNIFLQFQMEECHLLLTDQVDLVNPEGHRVVPDMSKPLPLGGPPGQVTIQTQYFFNKDLEYLVSGDKGRSDLSISKLKAAQYLDFGLEELVPSLWIESEREYEISAAYGISHWWFKRKEFYITRHNASFDRSVVRSHMRILSVVSLKTYERYRYTFLKEIVLRRANYKEYKISEADFKNLHPNDFKDLYLLHLQGQLNLLSGADKVHLFNAVNLWIRNIAIKKCVEDLQLGIEIGKPKAVIYRDRNDQKKMMRETEVHKFSDGTLQRILDKLDHMVSHHLGKHTSEADLKNLHLNDFEDLYLLHLQGQFNHLSSADKVHLFNAVNLWIRNIVIRKCVEDLQLGIESYQTKLISLNRIRMHLTLYSKKITHNGTLNRILDKLDHMVKDFKMFKFNPGMETRIWSEVDRRRSKEFIEVIEIRLKIRRIFRSLESFVGGRLRDVDYRLIQRTE